MSDSKCYYWVNGQCTCVLYHGADCSGYSPSCTMRKRAEPLAELENKLIDIVRHSYGIRPDGRH